MRKLLSVSAFATTLFLVQAQSPTQNPRLTGVWKADLQKSKIPGPPLTNYLVIFEEKTVVTNRRTGEKGPEIDETAGMWSEHGERRSRIAFLVNGKPHVRPDEGVPTRITAAWDANTLNFKGEVAGHPTVIKRTYQLSADGQTLIVDSLRTSEGREQQSTVVLLKQPDSAGEPLRKPEETAEHHFKNVKTELKSLPTSEFIDNMRYFAWSLDKDCEFCHVKDKFDSDDKKEKKTARKMIEMTDSIDENHFDGHPEVRCFTCHEGHSHPLSHPLFPDESTKQEAPVKP